MGQGSLCYTVGRGEYVIVEGEESIKVREGESIIAGEQECELTILVHDQPTVWTSEN